MVATAHINTSSFQTNAVELYIDLILLIKFYNTIVGKKHLFFNTKPVWGGGHPTSVFSIFYIALCIKPLISKKKKYLTKPYNFVYGVLCTKQFIEKGATILDGGNSRIS